MPTSQPLSIPVNVSVSVSPVAASTPTFNQGLILGTSTVIGAAQRVRQYSSLAAIATDGFGTSSAEYLAAQLYFAQTPTPQYLWIGRQDLTASETVVQALTACRAASSQWYACLSTTGAAADHTAVALWAESVTPQTVYFFTTADTAVLNNTAGNVLLTLQAANYKRSFGIYATTQAGAAPNNAYAAAAAMGVAMGRNTGLANSNFTMKFKQLVGVVAESLTQTQITNIQAANGNLYLSYANVYTWLEQGVTSSGQFLDETIGLDVLASDIQYSAANLLISTPAIPRSNAGQAMLLGAVNAACDRAVDRGFIAPGIWSGQTVLNLTAGQALPKGYMTQSQSFNVQSAGDRAARKAMPIYVTFIEAGAVHSLTIGVYVQR